MLLPSQQRRADGGGRGGVLCCCCCLLGQAYPLHASPEETEERALLLLPPPPLPLKCCYREKGGVAYSPPCLVKCAGTHLCSRDGWWLVRLVFSASGFILVSLG